MPSLNKATKITIFLFLCLFISANISYARDKIIAIVNDELITYSNLIEYIELTYAGIMSRGNYTEEELEKIRLDLEINGIRNIVEDKLILSKAKEKQLEVNERLVEERVDEIKARYPDEETFLAALVARGASISDIRIKIRDQLMIKFIVSNEVRSKIFVNPQEVTQFYEKHADDYKKKERINLDSIFIAGGNDKESAFKKAQEVLEKITDGEDFLQISKNYSDSSSIGMVERGQLMKKIEDVIFNLTEEEISSLVEVEAGIYIFKLKERLPAETATLEEVKGQIYNTLFSQKFEKSFNEWIEDLKKNAYIEIKE